MTIPMDNTSDNSSRERVQRLYNKNAELENKRRRAAQARIPSDPNAWQQMRENYEAIILEDYAFSEQHEVEYALWQLHYRRIEELRAHYSAALSSASQNGKGATRAGPDRVTKIRSQLKTFLSEATGFYHDLMVKIRAKYGLPLGYFSDDPDNQVSLSKDGSRSAEVKKGLVSCNRCLIYLGDLARYKGLYGEGDSKAREFATASSYYTQASSLWPSNGNPHHQLAILASYSGDDLVAVYRYFRSLAVESPFSTARENLIIAFEKNRQSYAQLPGDIKASSVKTKQVRMTGRGRGKGEGKLPIKDAKVEAIPVKEKASIPETIKVFRIRFVRLNGILFTRTSLETFDEVFSLTRSDFLELLSSGPVEGLNFGSDASECRLLIIRSIAILIFTVHNVNKETENQSYAEILQRSVVLQNAFTAIFEFMGHILERCTQLNDVSESYLLPGIMIFVEWLACRQDIAVGSELEERQASARSFFWKQCISLLNKLLLSGFTSMNQDENDTFFNNMSRYDEGETANRLALPEDFELRGFLPLLPAHLILDFSRKHYFEGDGGNKEKKARIERIIAAGKSLANVVKVGQQGIYYDSKLKRFAIGVEPQMIENTTLNHMGKENSTGNETTTVLQSKVQMCIEGDDEDEVIVFKPSVTKKQADLIGSNLISSEVILPSVDSSNVSLGNVDASFASSHNGFIPQNSHHTSSRTPTSLASISAQHAQPIQSSSLNWPTEELGSAVNGFVNLNLLENGFSAKPNLQDYPGVLQSASLARPYPQSIGPSAVNRYPVPASEIAVPSKLDSVMFSGSSTDTLPVKPSSVGLKKNPVSRPIRHLGPPPGFKSVPPKPVDESFSGITLKETQPVDDYSWLDGYQVPSSTQALGFSSSISAQSYHPVSKSDNTVGLVSFPFPGKQVSSSRAQMDNQNGWQDYQLSLNLKQYQEEQQQNLQKANQHPAALAQQYQGQSPWEGRFFV